MSIYTYSTLIKGEQLGAWRSAYAVQLVPKVALLPHLSFQDSYKQNDAGRKTAVATVPCRLSF